MAIPIILDERGIYIEATVWKKFAFRSGCHSVFVAYANADIGSGGKDV